MNNTEVVERSLEAYLTQIQPGWMPYELDKGLFAADQRPGSD